jgi:hypothetical protein
MSLIGSLAITAWRGCEWMPMIPGMKNSGISLSQEIVIQRGGWGSEYCRGLFTIYFFGVCVKLYCLLRAILCSLPTLRTKVLHILCRHIYIRNVLYKYV